MKNSIFWILTILLSLTLASCSDDEFSDSYDSEILELEEAIALESSKLATLKSSSQLPSTIDELRAAGINVSRGLARAVNNDLTALLEAASLSETRRGRRTLRRQGFSGRQIRQLRRINREYQALVESIDNGGNDGDNGDGGDTGDNGGDVDPGVDPGLTEVQQAFVNRFAIPQDVLDELIARNSLDRIINREQIQLSNPAGIVVIGQDLFEVTVATDQGTNTTRVTRTRAQLEGTFSFQYLFDSLFDSRLQTPNTAATFDRIGREVFQALVDTL